MKKSQVKSMFVIFMLFILTIALVYALGTTLISPADNFIDTDGYLDLRGSCTPTAATNATIWNVTNATLYSNVGGTWIKNITLYAINSPGNSTYLFNFTNHINKSAEGEYKWNIQCFEENSSTSTTETNSVFAGNNTIRVLYSLPTVSTVSPADGSYSFNGHEIDVVCKAKSKSGWNLTSIDLMTNIDGTWSVNQTHTPVLPEESEVVANFTINKFGNESIPDGTDLLFGCRANQWKNLSDGNEDPVTSELTSANRTVNIEYPPLITLNAPPDGVWNQSTKVSTTFTVLSKFGTNVAPFKCRLWTNDSGLWFPRTGQFSVLNDTIQSQDMTLLERTAIKWGLQCFDGNNANVFNFTDNRTLNIDTINPTLTVNTLNNSFSGLNVEVDFTATDTNLAAVKIFHNFNGTAGEFVNTSPITGESNIVIFDKIDDGVWNFSVWANDSAGREIMSANYTITVDLTAPNITAIQNFSVDGSCDSMNLSWTVNESSNYTIYLDTDTEVTDGIIGNQNTFGTSNSYIFEYGLTGTELDWNVNITSCDQAGNCQGSDQFIYTTPAAVCAGWSQYAIYDANTSLSVLQNESGADLVYIWNATNQDWVVYIAGLTTNANTDVGKYTGFQVIHLFENTNSIWFRNTSILNDGFWHYNITSGDNFVAVGTVYNFGNFTWSLHNGSDNLNDAHIPAFINISAANAIDNSGGVTSPLYNITFFDGYNNTLQDYMGGHVFNFSWSNATIIEPCPRRQFTATCMETVWFGSDINITWNGTNSYRNWSI